MLEGAQDKKDVQICVICGQRPAMDGEELCSLCWPEIHRFAKYRRLMKDANYDKKGDRSESEAG